jgi:hypothetical protein
MSTIIYVGGDKGGVGKSMVSIALCDYLKHLVKTPVLLIETDTENPDAAKCLEGEVDAVLGADTSTPEGWQDLLNTIEAKGDTITTVINAGARDNRAMQKFGMFLTAGAAELKATLIAGWVINAERDSLIALRHFLEFYPGKIFVIGNQFFDESGKFTLYQSSDLRKEIEKRGGGLLIFPALQPMLAAAIRNDRYSPEVQSRDGPLFQRIVIDRWRSGTKDVFQRMLE